MPAGTPVKLGTLRLQLSPPNNSCAATPVVAKDDNSKSAAVVALAPIGPVPAVVKIMGASGVGSERQKAIYNGI